MIISAILFILGIFGGFRYLTAKHRSAYSERLFRAYCVNLLIGVSVPIIGPRSLMIMLLPAVFALLFLGPEIHKALDQQDYKSEHLLFDGFTRYLIAFNIFCLAFSLYFFSG